MTSTPSMLANVPSHLVDLTAAYAVVDATHRYKEIFYD